MKPRAGKSNARLGLKLFPEKRVDKKYIKRFWSDWRKPERARKLLLPRSGWRRKILRLSPTILATVRRFSTPEQAESYAKNARFIENTIMGEKPKSFVLQPVQFFSRQDKLLLERVYPGPNLASFLVPAMFGGPAKYFEALKRRLKRKGINLEDKKQYSEVSKSLNKAFEELKQIEVAKVMVCIDSVNVLLLDFDPKTKKALFAIVDHGQPPSISE